MSHTKQNNVSVAPATPNYQPELPWDVLQAEVLARLPFAQQTTLACTCKYLSQNWGKYIHYSPPESFILRLNSERMKRFVGLTELDLSCPNSITSSGLAPLINLTSLKIDKSRLIFDAGILPLVKLRSLSLQNNTTIQKGTSALVNLTELNLFFSEGITNEGIAPLTNLTSLDLTCAPKITDAALVKLTNLTSLVVHNQNITDAGLSTLVQLTEIDLYLDNAVHGTCLLKMPKLKKLVVGENKSIQDKTLCQLTSLTDLDLRNNHWITFAHGVKPLVANLKRLDVSNCNEIQAEMLRSDTSFQHVHVEGL